MEALETNQGTDTPSQGSEQLSVEDAFFTSEETTTANEVIGTPAKDTPIGEGAKLDVEGAQVNNEERRFQYWQSEADKAKNENAQLKAQMQQVQSQQVQTTPAQQPEPVEEFPPAPDKPKAPLGFNRAEANEDPNSASAQYLNELDGWRDDIVQYNSLKGDYQTALVQEKFDAQETRRVNEVKRAQAHQAQQSQMNGIYNRVQGEYGLSSEDAAEFVQTMSKPESLTMDNLVQLYRMQKGSGQPVQTQPNGPSPTFNQQARAQQVPSPMGVIPAQQNTSTASSEDSIMDSIISGYKKNNPW
tara:strand:- start:97 stop:999 length:903 start_codon:yes stop_codon:yes gene_type:complete